jgi:hypothetical protein
MLNRLIFGMMALWAVSPADAQVTVNSVRVTVSSATKTAVWCDTSLACSAAIWDLGSGVTVGAGQTLVLTQTGLIPGVGGNFDTSDRATLPQSGVPTLAECSAADPCTVTVEINGIVVYTSASGNALNAFNNDNDVNETSPWALAATKPNYTLSLGYADNVHAGTCPAAGCFPIPFSGATYFKGAGSTALGACSSNCYDAGALLITGIAAPATATGRMTGGGSVFTSNGIRVTHGFELHCDKTDVPNSLEINWPGNTFHMNLLASAVCTNTAAVQAPPNAPFDTFTGTGTGKLNNVPGASIVFTLVDGGEPGTKDTAAYIIKDSNGNTVLTVGTTLLTKGNQQAHK